MQFSNLSVAELKEAAAYFGAEPKQATGRKTFVEALEEIGVTESDVQQWSSRKDEPVDIKIDLPTPTTHQATEAPSGNMMVVVMTRKNPRYDIGNHTFTKDHPFVLMTEDDAQEIFDSGIDGFRPATPREVAEYYS